LSCSFCGRISEAEELLQLEAVRTDQCATERGRNPGILFGGEMNGEQMETLNDK